MKDEARQETRRRLQIFVKKTVRKFEVSDQTKSPWYLTIAVESQDQEIIIKLDNSPEESYYQASLIGATLEDIILGDYEVVFVFKKPNEKERNLKIKYDLLLISPPNKD